MKTMKDIWTDKDSYDFLKENEPGLLETVKELVDLGASAKAVCGNVRAQGAGDILVDLVAGAINHYVVIKINAHRFNTTPEFVKFWDELSDEQKQYAKGVFAGMFEPEQYAWQVGTEGNILARRKLSGSGQILKHLGKDDRY